MNGTKLESDSTSSMTERRERIYAELQALIPWLMRRECVPRNFVMIDPLLDQLVEIQHEEAISLLENEEEVGYGL